MLTGGCCSTIVTRYMALTSIGPTLLSVANPVTHSCTMAPCPNPAVKGPSAFGRDGGGWASNAAFLAATDSLRRVSVFSAT